MQYNLSHMMYLRHYLINLTIPSDLQTFMNSSLSMSILRIVYTVHVDTMKANIQEYSSLVYVCLRRWVVPIYVG